jgi:hypothetical protein
MRQPVAIGATNKLMVLRDYSTNIRQMVRMLEEVDRQAKP